MRTAPRTCGPAGDADVAVALDFHDARLTALATYAIKIA